MNCPKCEELMELENSTTYYRDAKTFIVTEHYWCSCCNHECERTATYELAREWIEEQRAGQFLAGVSAGAQAFFTTTILSHLCQVVKRENVKFLLRMCYRSITGRSLPHSYRRRLIPQGSHHFISAPFRSCELEAGKAGTPSMPRRKAPPAGSWKLDTDQCLDKQATTEVRPATS